MRLEGAIGRTLTGLALAVALCLSAAAQSPPAQGLAAAPPGSRPRPRHRLRLCRGGGMASYEGLIVQKIDFPDLPSASTDGACSI